jgi:hypothetical protein
LRECFRELGNEIEVLNNDTAIPMDSSILKASIAFAGVDVLKLDFEVRAQSIAGVSAS